MPIPQNLRSRLAFSTLGCPDWDFDTLLSRAVQYGFGALEIRGIGSELRSEKLACFLPENQETTREALEKAGLTLCCVGTSCAFHDPTRHADALEEGRAALRICHQMGIPAIRVFGDSLPPTTTENVPSQPTIDGLTRLCDIAAEMGGTRVLMEVHGFYHTVPRLLPILNALGSHPAFGIIWDIQHSFRDVGNAIEPFYQAVKPYVKHVHTKDCILEDTEKGPECRITFPGEGQIDIAKIVRLLETDGYTGWYSFEWEKRWQKSLPEPEAAFPRYVKLMQTILG